MIEIDAQDKIRIAKSGANKLFLVDYDTRQRMDKQQLIELFDEVWLNRLRRLVLDAEVIEPEEVSRRLLDKHHTYVDPQQEHRSFRYLRAEFIAQLEPYKNGEYKLTQLWRVASSDNYPKTLFINFSSVEERELFYSLARSLDMDDEELGLRLIRNFMNLHPGYAAIDESNA